MSPLVFRLFLGEVDQWRPLLNSADNGGLHGALPLSSIYRFCPHQDHHPAVTINNGGGDLAVMRKITKAKCALKGCGVMVGEGGITAEAAKAGRVDGERGGIKINRNDVLPSLLAMFGRDLFGGVPRCILMKKARHGAALL